MKRTSILLLILSLIVTAHAKVLRVDDDGPADYASIAEALEAAVTGDEIVVADGYYRGPGNRDLDFHGKQVELYSENGPSHCVIDCGGSRAEPHRAFYIHSGETRATLVRGFTIVNGVGDTVANRSELAGPGGAILCLGGSITIENCLFTSNRASDGGAVAIFDSGSFLEDSVFIRNCTFCGNGAGGLGGALYVGPSGVLSLTNSISWDNRGGSRDEFAFHTGPDLWPSVRITYCTVQGGKEGILSNIEALPEGIFSWDLGVYDVDPRFASPSAWDEEGNFVRTEEDDYHLKSMVGRWDPNQWKWVKDDLWSPCIDAGEIGREHLGFELWPHGARVNLGAFGGILEASLSPSRIDMGDLNLDGLVDTEDVRIYQDELTSGIVLAVSDLDRDTLVGPNDLTAISSRFFVEQLPVASPQPDADPLVWRGDPDSQMRWAVKPQFIASAEGFQLDPGQGLIAMTAETFYATDGSSVEYLFVDDDHPEVDSGWISFLVGEAVTWIDKVPDAEDTYHYKVMARNSENEHETAWSEIIEVKPFLSNLFPDTPEWVTPPTVVGAGALEMEVKEVVDLGDPNSQIWYYFASWLYDGVVELEQYGSAWTTERVYTLSGLPNGEYRFSVKAGNGPFSEEGEPIFQTDYSQILGATVEWKLVPDSMSWKQVPAQLTVGASGFSPGAIGMEVEPVFDPNGDPVEYSFSHWLADGQVEGPHSSGWGTSPWYVTGSLAAGEYRFSAKARSQNAANGDSAIVAVTVDRTPPTPTTMSFATAPQYINPGFNGAAAMTAVAAQDASGGVQYWFDCNFAPFSSKSWQSSPSYEVPIGQHKINTYFFRVKARDQFGNETAWSNLVLLP